MNTKHIISVLILALLVCSTASAETANKDLPTKQELISFLQTVPINENSYTDTVFNQLVSEHPTWKCDVWTDKTGSKLASLYYTDPESTKGYGSIYMNDRGSDVTGTLCNPGCTLEKSWLGEEDKVREDTQTEENISYFKDKEEVKPVEEVKEEETEDVTEDETVIKIEYTKNDLKKMDNKERWSLIKEIYKALFGE